MAAHRPPRAQARSLRARSRASARRCRRSTASWPTASRRRSHERGAPGWSCSATPPRSSPTIDPAAAAEGVIFTDLDTAVERAPGLVARIPHDQGGAGRLRQVRGAARGLLAGRHRSSTCRRASPSSCRSARSRSRRRPASSIFTHTLIVLEEDAEAFLVDAYHSRDAGGAVVRLGRGRADRRARARKLRYVQVQDWGRNVWNFMTERAILDRDATLNSLHVTLGSKFTKNSIGSHLRGENALAEMLGIYFGDGDQFFDHHTWQLHESPYATSDLEFKGALRGQRALGLLRPDQGLRGRAEDRRLPAEPQPGPEPRGAGRLDPEPRDRRERRPLHARRDHLAGRGGAPLLPAGARHPADRGAEADRRGLLPPGYRPDPGRGDPGLPGERDRPQGRSVTGFGS